MLDEDRGSELTARKAAEATSKDAEVARARATEAHVERSARLTVARESLRRAQAALDLTDHRAALVDDAPCPLRGATEHPWAAGSPIVGLVDDAALRVDTLEREVNALTTSIAEARTRAESATAEVRGCDDRLASLQARRTLLESQWTAARVAPLPDEFPNADSDTGSVLSAVSTVLDETEQQLVRLRQQEVEAERLGTALLRALQEAQEEAALVTRATTRLDAARVARDQATSLLAENTQVLAEATRRVEEALDAAGPAFSDRPGWRDEAMKSAAAFRDACGRQVEAWRKAVRDREDARVRRADLAAARAAATLTAEERTYAAADQARVAAEAARKSELAGWPAPRSLEAWTPTPSNGTSRAP